MVSEKATKRKSPANASLEAPKRKKVTEDQPADDERNRKAEASGRKEDGTAPGSTKGAASQAARRAGGEVDELFGKLKNKAKAAKKADQPQEAGSQKGAQKRKPQKVAGSKDDIFGQRPAKTRRRDADGLTVYTEEELKVGKGGDTSLCPFDCDCCF